MSTQQNRALLKTNPFTPHFAVFTRYIWIKFHSSTLSVLLRNICNDILLNSSFESLVPEPV